MDKLRLRGISKAFGNNTVVDKLNLTLRAGEFVSLLGPSGCGKTTTLRMVAGFIVPTAGTIELDGRQLSSQYESLPPEKRRMSMIFQSYALWPNMTVEQNVAFGLKMRKVPKEEARKRVAEILDVVRLTELAKRYPNELSGGQQQRVSLARALVVKPEVLLLDEPLSNLDANLREEMRGEIRKLHNEFGITRSTSPTTRPRRWRSRTVLLSSIRARSNRSASRARSTSGRPTCSSPTSWGS
jgi:ABC-type Fe3+/spermidine/putrescine transport system ATPase subunit